MWCLRLEGLCRQNQVDDRTAHGWNRWRPVREPEKLCAIVRWFVSCALDGVVCGATRPASATPELARSVYFIIARASRDGLVCAMGVPTAPQGAPYEKCARTNVRCEVAGPGAAALSMSCHLRRGGCRWCGK